ncbi:MAG: peptidoglycan recognition family protein [Elusimicrobia bacterium]|nr:peptidoglycan recognition family protein [Elusimicrobiota bacterium]
MFSFPLAALAGEGENTIEFKNSVYPITINFSANDKTGTPIFESKLSEPPSCDYDTVLVQGEMPDPDLLLEISIQSKTQPAGFDKFRQLVLRRFPNGRFWAKYQAGQLTRQPVKLSVTNLGSKSSGTLIIYSVELAKEALLKEETLVSTAPYTPDASLYLPDNAPFKITRRADWKAAAPKEPYTPHSPVIFTIHHTAGHYPKNYSEAVAEIQFIQDYHQNAKGWIDIGYHFLISPQGDIFEGRPIGVVGAHVLYRNPGNVGVSIMGNYHPPASTPVTPEIVSSFVTLGRYMKDTYAVSVSSFYAHREIGQTDCPGDGLYARMPEFKGLIFAPQPAETKVLRQLLDSIKDPD